MNAQPRPEPPPEDPIKIVPRTELMKKLMEHRRRYIAAGGKLYTTEEILRDLRDWSGESEDES